VLKGMLNPDPKRRFKANEIYTALDMKLLDNMFSSKDRFE
jgi:hypothetical protein